MIIAMIDTLNVVSSDFELTSFKITIFCILEINDILLKHNNKQF